MTSTTSEATSAIAPLYVDVHVLQTVPPSNLNRDDTGSPKQAVYGGVRRARVSSQAWKRATRTTFKDHVPPEHHATRTQRIAALLSSRLRKRVELSQDDANRIATTLLTSLGITPGRRANETSYLLFFGYSQIERLVDEALARVDITGDLSEEALKTVLAEVPVKEVLGSGHPMDVALFGRMVADVRGLNVDAATQVAHAISTHEVLTEFDYYTAVDDEKSRPDDDAGASMIGTVEFNSSTLYRYATVGLHQLAANLGGDLEATLQALRMFLDSFVTSMPTGHRNSFAHRTAPDLVSVVVRASQPVNLVSAFEAPVSADKRGIAAQSARQLAHEFASVTRLWGQQPLHVASTYKAATGDVDLAEALTLLGDPMPFADVLTSVVDVARAQLQGA